MGGVDPRRGAVLEAAAGPGVTSFRGRVQARPRWWGLALAVAIGAAYLVAVRPARVALATGAAAPLFAAVATPRADALEVVPSPRGGADVYVVAPGGDLEDAAVWLAPLGALFVVPAMFLAFTFPDRPYWLYLLGYHLAVGAAGAAVFAVGLGWAEPAFKLYTFSRTYLTEAVSLAVPLLLWLAGRGGAAVLEGGPREGGPREGR